MFKDGPAVMDLGRLRERVEELKKSLLEDGKPFGTRFLPRTNTNTNTNRDFNRDFNVDDLKKP
jgi:hypothetical protein